MKDEDAFSDNEAPPTLPILNVVVTVTAMRSHRLPLSSRHTIPGSSTHRNGGSPRVTAAASAGACWWSCLSPWPEGMVSFVLSHHQLVRHPLPSSRRIVLLLWDRDCRGTECHVWLPEWCPKTGASRRVRPSGWRSQSSRHPVPTQTLTRCSF